MQTTSGTRCDWVSQMGLNLGGVLALEEYPEAVGLNMYLGQ